MIRIPLGFTVTLTKRRKKSNQSQKVLLPIIKNKPMMLQEGEIEEIEKNERYPNEGIGIERRKINNTHEEATEATGI